MFSRAVLLLGFVSVAIATESFWTCEPDTLGVCLADNPVVPPNHFCGPCFTESSPCTICKFFLDDPAANDGDTIFTQWWGGIILSGITALACIVTALVFASFVLCRLLGGRGYGGAYPNYGGCFASDASIPADSHATDRRAPDGLLLRPYTAKERVVPRTYLLSAGAVYLLALACFIVAVPVCGSSTEAFLNAAPAALAETATRTLTTFASLRGIVAGHPGMFVRTAPFIDKLSGLANPLLAARADVNMFADKHGRGIGLTLNYGRWFSLGFAFFAVVTCLIAIVCSLRGVQRMWPRLLTFVSYYVATTSWLGVTACLVTSWYTLDLVTSSRAALLEETVGPFSGIVSLSASMGTAPTDPLPLIDSGRFPSAAWDALCADADIAAACDTMGPQFLCVWPGTAPGLGSCAVAADPTRVSFNTYVTSMAFQFNDNINGNGLGAARNVTVDACIRGDAACSCSRYAAGGATSDVVAFDKCDRLVHKVVSRASAVRSTLGAVRALATDSFTRNGYLGYSTLRSILDKPLDDAHRVGHCLVWGTVGYLLLAIGATVAIVGNTMTLKRNIPTGHVPLLDEPEDLKATTRSSVASPASRGASARVYPTSPPPVVAVVQQPPVGGGVAHGSVATYGDGLYNHASPTGSHTTAAAGGGYYTASPRSGTGGLQHSGGLGTTYAARPPTQQEYQSQQLYPGVAATSVSPSPSQAGYVYAPNDAPALAPAYSAGHPTDGYALQSSRVGTGYAPSAVSAGSGGAPRHPGAIGAVAAPPVYAQWGPGPDDVAPAADDKQGSAPAPPLGDVEPQPLSAPPSTLSTSGRRSRPQTGLPPIGSVLGDDGVPVGLVGTNV